MGNLVSYQGLQLVVWALGLAMSVIGVLGLATYKPHTVVGKIFAALVCGIVLAGGLWLLFGVLIGRIPNPAGIGLLYK